jgi:hypothetical protein
MKHFRITEMNQQRRGDENKLFVVDSSQQFWSKWWLVKSISLDQFGFHSSVLRSHLVGEDDDTNSICGVG